MKQLLLPVVAFVVGFGILAPNSFAATITQTYSDGFPANITGTLPNQGTVLLENFTLPSVGDLTVTTTSYAKGGFEPNLLLYTVLGSFVTAGDPFGAIDPATGIVGDMRLTASKLPAGTYTLALTDFLLNQSLTATKLSDGFTVNFGSGETFVDTNGNPRTGAFAFTINAPAAAAVPEPGALWLVAPFLAALALRARKRLA